MSMMVLIRIPAARDRPPHPGPDLFPHHRHAALITRPHLLVEQLVGGLARLGIELGEVIGLEIELDGTVGNGHGIVNGSGNLGEIVAHLLGGFEIELVGIENEPVGIVDGLLGLDAQQNLVGLGVL
jgi:hypothetical protein